MFGKKKDKQKNDLQSFKSEKYQMKESYNAENLVVANLEYISSNASPYGPVVKKTTQKYIFEVLNENNKERYREVFTGFIADSESHYFDLPYVVNIIALEEQLPSVANSISKYGLLLVLNEINNNNTRKLNK